MNGAAGSRTAAEAANASPARPWGTTRWAAVNAPTLALFGCPLIGNGANAVVPGANGGAGGILIGNGGNGALGADPGQNGGKGGAAGLIAETAGTVGPAGRARP